MPNDLITELMEKRDRIERELEAVERSIAYERQWCRHERDPVTPEWCVKCGADMGQRWE